MTEKANIVSVFGGYDPRPGDAVYELARGVGEQLAYLGYVIANGGYKGVMEASAAGAKSAGGSTLGVTCRVWNREPNEFIDRRIDTDNYRRRLDTLIEIGRGGYVALPGATGTLVEVALVWELACKKLADRRPIVLMGAFWQPLVDMMTRQRPENGQFVDVLDTPQRLADIFPPVEGASCL